jgi:hexosaminidase
MALITAVVALAAAAPGAAATEERPPTIPALREWRPAPGAYVLARGARIVLAARDRGRLRSEARTLSADLRALTRRRPRVVTVRRGARLRRGDVYLLLGSRDRRLGAEGYRLALGRAVRVSARARAGVFFGTRTLLQLLRAAGRGRVAAGTANDWPRYPERGLMVDIGRQHFSPRWLAERVRELASLKLNRLHLHFSENEGWRIESSRHPEIVSERRLTKADVRALVALARRHHVTVVPEINMPGHMRRALARRPQLQLPDATGRRAPDKLDITSDAARAFARDLIEEYLPLFPARDWHMGGDEYLAVALPWAPFHLVYPRLTEHARARYGPRACGQDAFLGFVNWVDDLVRAHGKRLRVWGDHLGGGCAVRTHRDIAVEWWTNHAGGPSPRALLDSGHRILNAGWFPTYYVSARPSPVNLLLPPKADMRAAYESWEVNRFHGPLTYAGGRLSLPFVETVPPGEPRNLGSELHVWNDTPQGETEEQIAAGIAPRLRVIAQKTWGSPVLTRSYSEFETLAWRVR